MKDLENNIKFNYLYRDGGNYKIHGSEVFSNPECVQLNEVDKKIKEALISGEFFEPLKWGMKRLGFQEWNDDLDHFWNEFDSLEFTNETSTADKTISEFLRRIAL